MQPSTADPYWAYVPNPPLLHPVSWNERNVPVYVNDTQALGVPSSHHIKATSHGNYTYFGMNGNVPICLSKGGNYTGCVTVNETTLTNKNGTRWTVIMQYLGRDKAQITTAPRPRSYLPCKEEPPATRHHLSWRRCYGDTVTRIPIPGLNLSLYNWTPVNKSNPQNSLQSFTEGLWTMDHKIYQTDLWKLSASMGTFLATALGKDNSSLRLSGISACVPEPYALLVGNVTITAYDSVFNVSCEKCNLTNCVKLNSNTLLL